MKESPAEGKAVPDRWVRALRPLPTNLKLETQTCGRYFHKDLAVSILSCGWLNSPGAKFLKGQVERFSKWPRKRFSLRPVPTEQEVRFGSAQKHSGEQAGRAAVSLLLLPSPFQDRCVLPSAPRGEMRVLPHRVSEQLPYPHLTPRKDTDCVRRRG